MTEAQLNLHCPYIFMSPKGQLYLSSVPICTMCMQSIRKKYSYSYNLFYISYLSSESTTLGRGTICAQNPRELWSRDRGQVMDDGFELRSVDKCLVKLFLKHN